jgi:N4-gp56 family major capsid protein
MAIIANTQMAPTKMDLIVAMAQRELKANAQLAGFFSDKSQFAVKGTKSISFPKLSSFSAQDRASGVAGAEQVVTASVDQLLLDKNKQVLWVIDPSDEIQSTLNWELETVKLAASAHGRQFDSDLVAAAMTARTEVSASGNITRDLVLEMIEYLSKNFANKSQIALFISPAQKTAMLKISEFTQAQIYGNAVIPSGTIGSVYGVPVVEAPILTSAQFFMADKDGLAYGLQKAPAYDEQKAIEYGAGAMKRTLDQLYGVKALQIAQGTAAAGKSALIIGYNDGV